MMTRATALGLVLIALAAVLASILGMAGALGQAEAMLRYEAARWLLANYWNAVMIMGPGLCVSLGSIGGMLMVYGLRQPAKAARQAKG